MGKCLDKLVKEAHQFEKKAGWEKTTKPQLIKWMKKEFDHYQKSSSKKVRANKIMDIIVLAMQLARREKFSLDKEWKIWWKKSEKYLK